MGVPSRRSHETRVGNGDGCTKQEVTPKMKGEFPPNQHLHVSAEQP